MATIENIRSTYVYVKDIIDKINKEKNKTEFKIPENNDFKYAFINSIQKFELPNKFIINHNDLSEFSRYFFPYVVLVIEPRKRQSKIKKKVEKGKYGTYLRYTRISRYENPARIEQRILYFMRNYEYNDIELAKNISTQFNITLEKANEEIKKVREKYPHVKKSRKILKKLEDIPKYKLPGIGIDIQGKSRDRYKIRIAGARDKPQLDRMISFMNILIFLYIETYLYKKPYRQKLKNKLKELTKIAKRRHKVDELVDRSKDTISVKQITKQDAKRIGFKPEEGQNQWTRMCQNSGKDKRRRPQLYTKANINELMKKGYKMNKTTGLFEKKIRVRTKSGKMREVINRVVKLVDMDDDGNPIGSEIYYTCNPKENGEHMFIGFLSRSNNPYGQCMPCCFKKDAMLSTNIEKKNYYLKCIGKDIKVEKIKKKIVGEKLYVLQDTNKIQDGRIGFLPKNLDRFLNQLLGKTRKISQYYLQYAKEGYYFKLGTKQEKFPFLSSLANIVNMNVKDLIKQLIYKLENDKGNTIFTAINNGDVRLRFKTRDKFIDFIKASNKLEFELINDLVSMPGIINKNGFNIIVFDKKTSIIKETLEKTRTKTEFTILCQNYENMKNILDSNFDNIIMIKENRNFYPIIMVTKKDEKKDIVIEKIFKYEDTKGNIIKHVYEYYKRNCGPKIIDEISSEIKITAKELTKILKDTKKDDFMPQYQIIDSRFKTKYIITKNSTILPILPSGSIHDLSILSSIDRKILSFQNTLKNINILLKISKKLLPIKPIGIYYNKKMNDKIQVIGIKTYSGHYIPTIKEFKNINSLKEYTIENKALFDKIDNAIIKNKIIVDNRTKSVNENDYTDESYQLFRMEFSEYINSDKNKNLKAKILRILKDKKNSKKQKIYLLKTFIYRLIDKKLYEISKNIQYGGKYDRFINIMKRQPKLDNYNIKNNREVCNIHKSRELCIKNKHCNWFRDNCYLSITKEMAIIFANKISEELVLGGIKASELLKIDNYFVSDIVDYKKFTEKENQKIVKSTNNTIKKELSNLFGDNVPEIGKRRTFKTKEMNFEDLNIQYPLQNLKDFYIQKIINNNLTVFRLFANGFYWIRNEYLDVKNRNIKYLSKTQTKLANYFRSLISDWIMDSKNINKHSELKNYLDYTKSFDEFIIQINNDIVTTTNFIIELYILNQIYKIPIIIYDDENNIIYIIDDGMKYDKQKNKDKIKQNRYDKYRDVKNLKNMINVRLYLQKGSRIPTSVDIIYFK